MAPQPTTTAPIETRNEPLEAVIYMLDTLIEDIKGRQPLRSDQKPLETYVYSQLAAPIMVDPEDFDDAWSPMGGIPFADVAAVASASGSDPAALLEKTLREKSRAERAFSAAFKTSVLVDELIKVSKDEIYRSYPAGRSVSGAYETVLTGMQPMPSPEQSPDTKRRVEEARRLLYDLDEEGNVLGKSRMYETYVNNARRYAKAKADFADKQQEHMADPLLAAIWPVAAARYRVEVDQAWNDLKSENGDKIEAALNTIESVGVPASEHMIAKAREVFDSWSVALGGSVAVSVPFSYIVPASWSDPEADNVGWGTLRFSHNKYKSYSAKNTHIFGTKSARSDSSSSSGGGGIKIFGIGAKGEGSTASSSSSSQSSSGGEETETLRNDARNLTVELEYGVCTVERPWLRGDLFYLKDWYIVNANKHSVSDGTLEDSQNERLFPLLPTQFLVIRNVKISTSEWGSDKAVLEKHFGTSRSAASGTNVKGGGQAGFSLGVFGASASGSHAKTHGKSSFSNTSDASRSSRTSTTFDGETLEIRGAQIVGWLSAIMPACAPLDDPNLKQA